MHTIWCCTADVHACKAHLKLQASQPLRTITEAAVYMHSSNCRSCSGCNASQAFNERKRQQEQISQAACFHSMPHAQSLCWQHCAWCSGRIQYKLLYLNCSRCTVKSIRLKLLPSSNQQLHAPCTVRSSTFTMPLRRPKTHA
jgi:hypothetical protein